jgi:hypothetical protein
MASTSSILKSATSAQNKVRAYEDDVAAYQWQLSAKTGEDWAWYSDYLRGRQGNALTPEDNLSYVKKINTAENQFVSQEIERASIEVATGNASTADKFNTMYGLFSRAMERGNYDLAQNLQLRLVNLQETMQNEAERAQRVSNTLAKNNVRTIEEWVKAVTKGDGVIELPDGTAVEGLGKINKDIADTGGADKGVFDSAYQTINAIYEVLGEAYQSVNSPEAQQLFEDKFASYFDQGPDAKTFNVGGQKLTFQEVDAAYRSSLANNPIWAPELSYNADTGEQKYVLKRTVKDDYTWAYAGLDANGQEQYEMIATRTKATSPTQSLDTKVYTDKDGNRFIVSGDKNANGKYSFSAGEKELSEKDYKNLPSVRQQLESNGYTIAGGTGNEFSIRLPDGRTINNVLINPDGSVRYLTPDGLTEYNPYDNTSKIVTPENDTQIFGRRSEFGGMLSAPTPTGDRLTDELIGKRQFTSDVLLSAQNSRIATTAPDTLGFSDQLRGVNLQGSNTDLLQGASTIRTANETQQKLLQQAEAVRLQAAQTALQSNIGVNLNQMPVGNTNLQVARPQATPRVTVSKPTPTPKITGVAPAQNVGRITGVVNATPSGTLKVR